MQSDPEDSEQGVEDNREEEALTRPRFTWNAAPEENDTSISQPLPIDPKLDDPRPVSTDEGFEEASTSGRDHPSYHPREYFGPKQRVWILCGGAGSDANISLESGINMYNILKNQMDLIVSLLLYIFYTSNTAFCKCMIICKYLCQSYTCNKIERKPQLED